MTATTTRAATATLAGLILALDFGKYKTVACAYDRAEPAAPRFESVTTDREHLRRLFAKVRPEVVVFEACLLAGWVHDLCGELGLPCKVANTASEAWKFKHTKRKTDRDDALRLAELAALGRLPTVALPDAPTRQWRQLIAHRQTLVGRRAAAQNRLRAPLVGQGLPAPRGAAVGRGRAGGHRRVRQAAGGVRPRRVMARPAEPDADRVPPGPRTAEAVVAHLHQPGRFASGKQVSADGGLVPRQYQSGETDLRGRITRRGPALLRQLLVECA
jgi:transposase